MHFELVNFLNTLGGLTRKQVCESIAHKQEKLMFEISQPKVNGVKNSSSPVLKFQISFLHQLKNEIINGMDIPISVFDQFRISVLVSELK